MQKRVEVFVRNVPANATEDQLREHLTKSCRGASVGAVRMMTELLTAFSPEASFARSLSPPQAYSFPHL